MVGALEHFLFLHILGMSSSQLTNSYFSEGWVETTNQIGNYNMGFNLNFNNEK
jgi:hypothetical protein